MRLKYAKLLASELAREGGGPGSITLSKVRARIEHAAGA